MCVTFFQKMITNLDDYEKKIKIKMANTNNYQCKWVNTINKNM